MQSKRKFDARYLIQIAVAASLMSAAWLPSAFATQVTDNAVDNVQAQAVESWRENMAHAAAPAEGCFQASYPSIIWEQVACHAAPPHDVVPPRSRIASRIAMSGAAAQTTGSGDDYVLGVPGLISQTVGTFPTVTGVTSEKGVGVAAYGGGGILGANEYSLQINSSFASTTAACKGHSGCTIWQQFVYAPDYNTQGEAAVFIESWLIGYGGNSCPSGGWESDGEGDCVQNSAAATAPDVPITQLANLKLSGSATAGGNDTVVFTNGTKAYTASVKDSLVDLASVWNQSEFNIVGNAGGSEAKFNTGSTVKVKVAVSDGSTAAPTCLGPSDAGTTGETNNLNLGSCSASSGSTPSIQFTESN